MATDSDVQKIKDRLSIVDIVGQYVQLKKTGRNYIARCPFHKERTPSFMVSPERGTYICFGCGEKGDIFSFVQKMEGTDFPTALKQLADKAGVKLTPRSGFSSTPERKEKEERLREVCEAAVQFFEGELVKRKDVQTYIKVRGVTEETRKTWRLGFAPATWNSLIEHLKLKGFTVEEVIEAGFGIKSEKKAAEIYDRFRGRIMFPLFDLGGDVIAFSGRFFEKAPGSIEGEPSKYVNSPETLLFRKSRVLYGLDKAKNSIRKADCILLVEGQFDVIMAHQSGLPFAVALSGTALTPEHLSLLGRFSKRLVLALDSDAAGLRAGLKNASMALSGGFDVKVPTFPPGRDPADMARQNPELLKAAIRTSKTAIEFFLDALQPSARDERAYKKTVEFQVLPLISAVGSAIEREYFIHLVAMRLSVPESAVRIEVLKHPTAPPLEEEVAPISTQEAVAPLDKKAAMLLFHFGKDATVGKRLQELIGEKRLSDITKTYTPQSEYFRFKFDTELGEQTSEAALANDMLNDIERILNREAIAHAGADTKLLHELARRGEELRK